MSFLQMYSFISDFISDKGTWRYWRCVCFVFRLAGGRLLFMDSMVAIPVEVLKHNHVNLSPRMSTEEGCGERFRCFSGICFCRPVHAEGEFRCYLFNLLSIYLSSIALILASYQFSPNQLDFYWHIICIFSYHSFKCMGGIRTKMGIL